MSESTFYCCKTGRVFSVLAMLLLSLPGVAWAQALEGQVRDTDRQPLPGVNVVVPSLQRGAVTDEAGRYVIGDLPVGMHTVEFRFIGFKTVTHTITLTAGHMTLDVTLELETLRLEEVVKTAEGPHAALNRATLSVSRLEPKEVEELRGQTLGETLKHLPGVTTLTTGPSIAKPVIRGLHSQRVLVLNAGVPQEGQQWGGEHAPEIDPFAPVRIEVVRGARVAWFGIDEWVLEQPAGSWVGLVGKRIACAAGFRLAGAGQLSQSRGLADTRLRHRQFGL